MPEGKENYTDEKVYDGDLNQIAKNANDGGGFRDDIEAHESITALRPVFLDDTENQWKYSDANDTGRMRFDGFALEAGSADTAMAVQLSGIVRGLSSLDVGKKYYLQDDGTIGTTPGTNEILVGIAVSATELLILKNRRVYTGALTLSATGNTTITCGFKASKISIFALGGVDNSNRGQSIGGYTVKGGNACIYFSVNGAANSSALSAYIVGAGITTHSGEITNITETSFRIDNTTTNAANNGYLYIIAEE